MSIQTKVLSCFLGVLVFFGTASLYSYTRFRQANSRLELVTEAFLPLSRTIGQLQSHLQSFAEEVRRFHLEAQASTSASTFSRSLRDLYPYAIGRRFSAAESLLAKAEAGGTGVRDLSAALSQAHALFTRLSEVVEPDRFESLYQDLRHRLAMFAKTVDDSCQSSTRAARAEVKDNLITSLFLSVGAALFGVLSLAISHRILSPLPSLTDAIKKIASGDFNQRLRLPPREGNDELSVLSQEYNRMLEALRERDRKIGEQQKDLLQAERLAAVGQLSAEIVHEIRNPLNSIGLNVDWLQQESAGERAEVVSTLESVSREIVRLNHITERYLVSARVPVTEGSRTEVNELIEEILSFSKEEDRVRNITIECRLSTHGVFVQSDRSRLKQALLNMLRNAREAMPNGGRLTVTTEVLDNVYRVLFSDTGHGMNDSTRVAAFRPFFTTKPNGTGLGLMLTKSIVEDARGTLQCESQLGKGTTFTIQFPV